jgi:2-aminoadipate transaminase
MIKLHLKNQIEEERMKKISFASGSLGKNRLLEGVLKKAIGKVNAGKLMNYENPLGLPELRESIAKLYGKNITAENVMITSSSQQALAIAIKYLARDKKVFLVQEPAYFGILRLIKNERVTTFGNLNELDLKNSLTADSVIYLTSNFRNPTGESLPWEEKVELAEHCQRTGATIIEDNPHDLLYFENGKPVNIFELAPENTIYVGGFSKILAPGIRVGYIISSRQLIEAIKAEKINEDIFTSTLGQYACLNALEQPEYLEKLRHQFKIKRGIALKSLDKYFAGEKNVKWNIPDGGIFIQLELPANIDMLKFIEIARSKHNLVLDDDRFFYIDGKSRNTTRINFVQNSEKNLQEGMGKLFKAYKEEL